MPLESIMRCFHDGSREYHYDENHMETAEL